MKPIRNYSACTSMIVGKKASIDGSIMIARNEDSKASWPKNYVVHPAKDFNEKQTFKSTDNGFTMQLESHQAQYSATPEWTNKFGLFEENGFNEFGVAMSATESTYTNDRVLAVDPLVKDGIGEEAMITVVLPYVKTAREGVARLGQIIEHYGTDESNGILFADSNDAWYMETGGGHNWVAIRIPDDAYAVIANQMAIQNIDFSDSDNFMWSTGIREFVNENHLNPDPLETSFNFREIFGTSDLSDTYYNTPRVWYGVKMFSPNEEHLPTDFDIPFLHRANRKLSAFDVQDYLSSHYQGTEYDPIGEGSDKDKRRFRPVSVAKTQEAHILQIRPDMPIEANLQWLSMGVGAQSVFVPFYAGATDTPDYYQDTKGEYEPGKAYWVYKQAGVLVDSHYLELGGFLSETQQNLRIEFNQNLMTADKAIKEMSGKELQAYVTKVNFKNAKAGLDGYNSLISKLITKSTDFSPINYKQDVNL
ncbi:dipeptidase [Lentilactobacillus curieae]|uniref:Dipeptidase n=1 Tax=Lentilactobacillus curieae TaxID=1138822 RepID=A0A1S6QKF7_9LACO|nr:C69 family dipeptidase [Lentilactobacillus curieae]AQW22079.1 dipeptidase [Lentilactobacillus curieae]